MHDIVIRGGTILDGTGFEAFAGDLAIDGDRIVAVGGKLGPGRRDIDANGLLVTPGWVDVHTHNDPRPERGRASNFAGDSAEAERSAVQHAHPHRALRLVNRSVSAQS